MSERAASSLRKDDVLMFRVENGWTRARVQAVREADPEEVWIKHSNPPKMLAVNVCLQRAVWLPDLPGFKTRLWTMFLEPGQMVELYEKPRGVR